MRISAKPILYAGAAMAVMSLGSCSLYNDVKDKIFGKKEQAVRKEVVLPQDREAILVKTDPKMYSPEEFSRGVIKGDWAIESAYGQEAVGRTAPYLKFAQDEHRIYGNNGCNTINGKYEYNPADSTLVFSDVIVTMMLCAEEGITDYLINQALNETRRYELEDVADGYLMNFYDEQGKAIMKLTHQNLDFLNGTWKVVAIDGEDIDVENMKLVFDVDEHKVHGNTGCNVLNGRLETDMDQPNTFSFESIAVTMMLCPQMQYQSAMLVALEEASRAKPIDKDRVQLLDDSGRAVITLQRTSDK